MRLPNSVQEIADVIGVEQALYLIGKLPRCFTPGKSGSNWKSGKRVGTERVIMYVPKRLEINHPLVQIIGWQDAQKLVAAFGGEIMYPATCSCIYREFRDVNIVRIVLEGVGTKTVAEWFDVSDRHVRKLVQEIPQEERRAANDNNLGSSITPKRRTNDQEKTEVPKRRGSDQ